MADLKNADELEVYLCSRTEVHLHRGYDGARATHRWQVVEEGDQEKAYCSTDQCLNKKISDAPEREVAELRETLHFYAVPECVWVAEDGKLLEGDGYPVGEAARAILEKPSKEADYITKGHREDGQ